eukprot:c49943_g1_i1 orf=43-348(-)
MTHFSQTVRLPTYEQQKISIINSFPVAMGDNYPENNWSGTFQGQEEKKALLPLQSCLRPLQNQTKGSNQDCFQSLKGSKVGKVNREPQLKANFRRIKKGML